MSVVISKNVVMSQLVNGGAGKPVIGWHNLVTRTNITADHADQYFPVVNLSNPSTASQWRSTSLVAQSIRVAITSTEPIDYVGIARHNLGTDGALIVVEAKTVDAPSVWTVVFDGAVLPNDGPAILRFDPVVVTEVSINITPVATPPRIGVLYVGRLTVMQEGMQQDVAPIPYAFNDDIVTGQAESGDYLGRIVTRQSRYVEYTFLYVQYDWFKRELGKFMEKQRTTPFFFAWLPREYPDEVGFGWLDADVDIRAFRHEFDFVVNFTLQIGAIAV